MASLYRKPNGKYVLIDQSVKPRRWINLGNIPHFEAKQVLKKYESDTNYLRLGLNIRPEKMTLSELVAEYIVSIKNRKAPHTVNNEEQALLKICKTFGALDISEVKGEGIERNFHSLEYKPNSFRLNTQYLKSVFSYAISQNYLSINPVDAIKRPRLQESAPRGVDPLLLEKVFSHMKASILTFYKILYYTGMRPSEVLRLRAEDVDLPNKRLFVVKTKTGRFRVIPIHPQLVPYFQKLPQQGHLFTFNGEPQKSMKMGLRRAKSELLETIHKVKEKKEMRARLKTVFPYAFRHTFATQVLAKTSNLRAVQTLLGHSKSSMTERYAHALNDQLKDAVETL